MDRHKSRKALLLEVHKAIAESATHALAQISGAEPPNIAYPPGTKLLTNEIEALSQLQISADARNALGKLLTDACSYPMHHLCCLLDGVSEPYEVEVDGWAGGKLEPAGNNNEMLHDEFCGTFWDFHKE